MISLDSATIDSFFFSLSLLYLTQTQQQLLDNPITQGAIFF